MGIVEVTGGVDTHADFHVAAVVDANGGLLGVESFRADAKGFEGLLVWLTQFGSVVRVGVEGTGSYGVGLARFLAEAEVEVVEVDLQNRQVRNALPRRCSEPRPIRCSWPQRTNGCGLFGQHC